MKVTNLRASTINTYKNCQFQFYLQYILGYPSKSGFAAVKGTLAHWVLEILAKAKQLGYNEYYESFRTNPEFLLDVAWNRYSKEYPEFEWSKKDYEFCKDQVYAIINSEFDPLKLKILKTEHQFEIDMNLPGFQYDYGNGLEDMKIRGTADLICEFDSETLHVIDYKTGKRLNFLTGEVKEYEDFFNDIQLKMYNLATSVLYPEYKYRILTIIFTSDGGPFSITFSEEDLDKTINEFRQIFQEIKNNTKPTRLLDNKDRFTEVWKCDYLCSAGLMEIPYISDDGDVIYVNEKRIWNKYRHKRGYPLEIEKDGKIFVRSENNPRRMCDRLYNVVRFNSLEKASEKLTKLTLDGEPVSRRNDYGNSKISKMKFQEE